MQPWDHGYFGLFGRNFYIFAIAGYTFEALRTCRLAPALHGVQTIRYLKLTTAKKMVWLG